MASWGQQGWWRGGWDSGEQQSSSHGCWTSWGQWSWRYGSWDSGEQTKPGDEERAVDPAETSAEIAPKPPSRPRAPKAQPRQGRVASTVATEGGHGQSKADDRVKGQAATTASLGPPPRGQAAAGASVTEPVDVHVEAFAVLQRYFDTLRRDSYTKRPLVEDCVTISRYCYEEGVQRPAGGAPIPEDKVSYRAEFDFPSCCRLRRILEFTTSDRNSGTDSVFQMMVGLRKLELVYPSLGATMPHISLRLRQVGTHHLASHDVRGTLLPLPEGWATDLHSMLSGSGEEAALGVY